MSDENDYRYRPLLFSNRVKRQVKEEVMQKEWERIQPECIGKIGRRNLLVQRNEREKKKEKERERKREVRGFCA